MIIEARRQNFPAKRKGINPVIRRGTRNVARDVAAAPPRTAHFGAEKMSILRFFR